MVTLFAMIMTVGLVIITLPISLPIIIWQEIRRGKIKKDTYNSSFVYYKDFEKYWLSMTGTGRYGNRDGFKYQDGSGCYIITVYPTRVTDGKWKNYENVYVGQSKCVYQRVHNHFNGKGNGDVYADIKYGKWVYVSFVRCEEYELNQKEIELISIFNATRSYNKTRGGA